MVLIAYDGSVDAKSAIARAGELFGDEAATVLCVWEPFEGVLVRTGAGFSGVSGLIDLGEIDHEYENTARERAEEGVGLARTAGLNARSGVRRREGTIA